MRNKLDRLVSMISLYRLDITILIGLAVLNLPLLLDVPYVFNFDTTVYLSVALNFINGHGFALPSGYPSLSSHPILFPLILAFFIKITPDVLSAVWMVKIFSVLTVWAAYVLGRCLFNRWAGGLTAVMITFSLLFRETFNYAYIDTISAFLLILGLLFIFLGYKRRGVWLVLSGFSMGLAFLLKESAIFWAPLPWLLFFVDWRYRLNTRLIDLWAYTILVVISMAGWMLWSYRWVGQMYPISSNLTTFVIRWGGFALSISAFASYTFIIANRRLAWFASLCKNIWFRRVFLVLCLSASVLIGPLITLFQNLSSGKSLPWVEIPVYISRYNSYFPAFGLIAIGCIIVVARAIWIGDVASVFGALVLATGFPWLSSMARSGMPPRQIMGFVFIAYLLAIGALFWGLEWLQPPQKGNLGRVIYSVSVLGILSFALWSVQHQNTYFYQSEAQARQREELPHTGWFYNCTLRPAAWIKETIPPGTPLLSSYLATFSLFYQTDGRYPIFELPTLNVLLDPLDSQQIFVPLSYSMRAAYLPLVGKKLEVLPREIIYLGSVYTEGDLYFHVIMEQDILTWLQENRIEYVVLTGDYLQEEDLYMDYFASNPGFKLVWSRKVGFEMPIYIFRVDYAKLHPQGQYPIVMSPATLKQILNRVSSHYSVENLANYFPRDISLRPLTKNDVDLAASLARYYLKTGRFAPAYSLFKSIESVAPEYVGQQLGREAQEPLNTLEHCVWYLTKEQFVQADAFCNTAKELFPKLTTPCVALGEIAMAQGQFWQAIEYYQAAIQIHADISTYIRLGDAYRLKGQFGSAQVAYQQAAALEPTNQIAQAHLAELDALQMQIEGEWKRALYGYREAIALYPTYWPAALPQNQDRSTSGSEYVAQDFLAITSSAQQNIMIINRRPMQTLLANNASYSTIIPEEARLSFSLGTSPDVWQVGEGDGVQFDVFIDNGSTNQDVFATYIDPKNIASDRRWHDYEIDLSPWSGQIVTITFAVGCGPNNDCRFDWAGWGEPSIIQPVAYNFLENYTSAQVINTDFGKAYIGTQTINYESRTIIFQHPTSRLIYSLELPKQSSLDFGIGMPPEVWSPDKGDGVEYNIYVRKSDEPYKLYRLFHKYIDPKNNTTDRRWFDELLNLNQFGGQRVEIIFETLPGPIGNINFDWGGWSNPVLVAVPSASLRTIPLATPRLEPEQP